MYTTLLFPEKLLDAALKSISRPLFIFIGSWFSYRPFLYHINIYILITAENYSNSVFYCILSIHYLFYTAFHTWRNHYVMLYKGSLFNISKEISGTYFIALSGKRVKLPFFIPVQGICSNTTAYIVPCSVVNRINFLSSLKSIYVTFSSQNRQILFFLIMIEILLSRN